MIIKVKTLVFCENFMSTRSCYGKISVGLFIVLTIMTLPLTKITVNKIYAQSLRFGLTTSPIIT